MSAVSFTILSHCIDGDKRLLVNIGAHIGSGFGTIHIHTGPGDESTRYYRVA